MSKKPPIPNPLLKLTLVDNARSFLSEALAKAVAAERDAAQWKFAILHLVQAIELSLKELLRQQHPILIFKNVDKPEHTVALESALQRLETVSQFKLTSDEYKALRFAAKLRNQIVHHEFAADPRELRAAFARLFGFLVDFHRLHCDYTVEEVVPAAVWTEGVRIKEYGEELFRRAEVRLKADAVEDCVITCPHCGWPALPGFGDHAETCYVCQRTTALESCDRCQKVMLRGEGNAHEDKTLCQNCLEYVTDDYWHDSAKEGG